MPVQTDSPLDLEPLLDEEQTARILDVVPGTLSVWRSTDRYDLPYVKVSRRVKYRPKDLREFIQRRTRTHSK